jgi:hypothetical protein
MAMAIISSDASRDSTSGPRLVAVVVLIGLLLF